MPLDRPECVPLFACRAVSERAMPARESVLSEPVAPD
jgi:hypothetical protein